MSSGPHRSDQLVEDYITRVRYALRGLPWDRRESFVEEIREHIRTARSTQDPEDEASIRQVLDDLGAPEAIRAEAGLPSSISWRPEWGDRWAPWLLLFGGFAFGLGWLLGLWLLWQSSIWRLRDKVLATLIWPGGLYAGFYIGTRILAPPVPHPYVSPNPLQVALVMVGLVAAVAAPIVVNVRLIGIQRRWAGQDPLVSASWRMDRTAGLVALGVRILLVLAGRAFPSLALGIAPVAMSLVALVAFVVDLVTPPVPTGWRRFALVIGMGVALLLML